MMAKKMTIFITTFSVVVILSISAIIAHANNNNSNAYESEIQSSNYEKILEPYRNAFEIFNSTHGTTYGFLTDEQLSNYNIDKMTYLQNVVEEYSTMTIDEFMSTLEAAYYNDNSAQNLPYYQAESQSNQTYAYSCPSPSKNGNNVFLLNQND